MKKTSNDVLLVRILAASALAAGMSAHAADAPAVNQNDSEGGLEEIVVTASGGDKTHLNSSVSVTSVSAELIQNFKPSSEAEVFRMIPGIQVAGTSGPGGNSNIAVRGLPVATGGSPFVQIQEDGLPTVLFGDIQFGNNDYWTHFDSSVERVEGVRGGSASTFASQAPGAVINYISNTGKEEGGFVQLSRGLGFDDNKVDFRYGGAASDTVHYHVGGYVHNGRGPLDAGYNVSQSAQVKANLTKDLADNKGYIRFLLKIANTTEPNYTGAPGVASLSGKTISDLSPYPGFDGRSQSNYSILNQNFQIVNRDGALESVKMDGITTKALSLGTQLHYEFNDQIKVDNNMRWTSMSGAFSSPFLNVGKVSDVIGSTPNSNYGAVASIRYANGPRAGQLYAGPYLNNNTNVRTNIRDVGSFADDLGLSGKFNLGAGDLTTRAGLFTMNQKIAMDWHTDKAYSELSGNNPAMLNLFDAAGNQLTANGIAGFNNNWGSCCARDYDLAYTDTAPYLSLDFNPGRWDFDGSVRFDSVHASGWTHSGGSEFNTNVNGVLIPTMLPSSSPATSENLDYTEKYTSWSLGGLFKVTDSFSAFVRASRGGRFNGDRQTVSGKINADGSLTTAGKTAAVDFVNQYEAGIKARGNLWTGHYTAEVTLLKGDFKQSTYELSATKCPGGAGGCVIDAKYQSSGVEVYATYGVDRFNFVVNATYVKPEKEASGASSFTRADGMSDLTFTMAAGYNFAESVSAGLNITGQTSQIDGGGTEYPASATFGGFLRYSPVRNLELGLQVYNLFDKFDIRGSGGVADSSVTPTVVSGAPVIGRTLTASIKLSF